MRSLTGQDNDFLKIVLPAAAAGKVDAVKSYLETKPSYLHRIGPHGRTMLWEAARGGKFAMVKLLVELGADIEGRGCYNNETLVELSPWCIATFRGRSKVAELLRQYGSEYRLESYCFLGDLDRVRDLISKTLINKVICEEPGRDRLSALHYAVAGRQLDVAKFLISEGADAVTDGERMGSWAVGHEHSDMLRLLLDNGATLRPGDANEACLSGRWASVLSGYGYQLDINAPDRLGFPPLIEACRGNHNATENIEEIQRLLRRGADVAVRDHKGKTALHRAAQANFTIAIQALFDAGADLDATDTKGETPLYDAIRAGREESAALLIELGADTAARNNLGQSVSLIAERSKKPTAELIKSVVRKGRKAH
ncbi:ankyrin repeat domain-containing protein [Ruegeria hyattellae]|uniref:ankyrin repeat domain-containing protein n=1 Tax=Ruegeria hyattellae TaxID=3233337 RepID=UPI00355B4574